MSATTRRPLRQYYDQTISLVVDDDLGSVVEPWRRHRLRFLEALGTLTDEQWATTSRCTAWDAKDVISHLVTVDGFWAVSLSLAGQSGPTTFIEDFDPTSMPDALVDPMRAQSPAEVLAAFAANQQALIETVDAVTDWTMLAESPMGHLTARLILAHGLWDSWLHERDIFEALGVAVPIETDELLVCTWYGLFFAGLQGGLIGDETPAGVGPTEPIDVALAFDDLPGHPIRVQIDRGVHLGRAADDAAVTPAGSAVLLIDQISGRCGDQPALAVPPDLAAQIRRAAQTL